MLQTPRAAARNQPPLKAQQAATTRAATTRAAHSRQRPQGQRKHKHSPHEQHCSRTQGPTTTREAPSNYPRYTREAPRSAQGEAQNFLSSGSPIEVAPSDKNALSWGRPLRSPPRKKRHISDKSACGHIRKPVGSPPKALFALDANITWNCPNLRVAVKSLFSGKFGNLHYV